MYGAKSSDSACRQTPIRCDQTGTRWSRSSYARDSHRRQNPTESDWLRKRARHRILTNDAVEVSALREVFGSHAENLLVSSTKSIHGHAV